MMILTSKRGYFWSSIGKRADPNSVRPGTRPIGRYTGRVSGWDSCHPLRIGLRSVGLGCLQSPARVQLLKVVRVAGSPDVTGELLIRLRWSDFPLQSEMGIAPIKLK